MDGKRVIGLAARDSSGHLSPFSFTLRKIGTEDMLLKVLFCGMDHTDLHQIRSEIYPSSYPLVPGHEVVGEVVELGSEVKKFKVGDIVGVGCLVGSCGECLYCNSNLENYCNGTFLLQWHQQRWNMVVVKIPEKLVPEQAAPLLCAGVTAYCPLKQFRDSDKILRARILGLGGVGHIGVLIAKAMGHHVTVISSSDKKRMEALEHLGADAFLVSSDGAEMEKGANSLDYILDTVPAFHNLQSYLSFLNVIGKLIIVGKKTITGSFVGSMEETREILDFWAEKGLYSMIEVVKMDYANKAFERMERNDVRYRFVLDVAGSNME
ncbi:hypothetical protein Dsin_008701 [Dipteronia sinensis]|uniref:cinnamyl-alcohol dehydrogenase n=1 Tax=Dipteronia sinensis TaxID=43782 RepID=A0AAE0EB16_9ROSI|nr:hypothetical protein Dsin_008701 [Dipteronia sinensis]